MRCELKKKKCNSRRFSEFRDFKNKIEENRQMKKHYERSRYNEMYIMECKWY